MKKSALRVISPSGTVQVKLITVQQLLTPSQLAEYLQVEVDTLYVWVSRRKIPYRKVGHLLRFDLNQIMDWCSGVDRQSR